MGCIFGIVDYALLNLKVERDICKHLQVFWEQVESCAYAYNPSTMCDYLFALAKMYSSW